MICGLLVKLHTPLRPEQNPTFSKVPENHILIFVRFRQRVPKLHISNRASEAPKRLVKSLREGSSKSKEESGFARMLGIWSRRQARRRRQELWASKFPIRSRSAPAGVRDGRPWMCHRERTGHQELPGGPCKAINHEAQGVATHTADTPTGDPPKE